MITRTDILSDLRDLANVAAQLADLSLRIRDEFNLIEYEVAAQYWLRVSAKMQAAILHLDSAIAMLQDNSDLELQGFADE